MKPPTWFALAIVMLAGAGIAAQENATDEPRGELEARVAMLEEEMAAARDEAWSATRQAHKARAAVAERSSVAGLLALLFGGFCAMWAQNTGRNPWLWFLLGALFNILAVLLALHRNRPSARGATAT